MCKNVQLGWRAHRAGQGQFPNAPSPNMLRADFIVIRLRVVKPNTRAVHFYQSRGWRVNREFLHEKFGHVMLEMIKFNETGSASSQ
jgi:hypothetical protein